jgi:rare lipoprotein A
MKTLLLIITGVCIFAWIVTRPYPQPPATSVTVTASWYGDECAGKPTANGELFDPSAMTCAMWDVPFDTRVRVQLGPRWVIVRVNDRGPAKRLNRGIDLSRAAFAKLADTDAGLITVELTILP